MKKHTDPDKASNGTSYFGHHFTATTASLRALFGDPHYPEGDYTIDEWVLDIGGGEAATVYHWGDTRYPEDQALRWHVGAHTRADALSALLHIRELLTPTT